MAVTAYPIILIDSTDGAASDSACSGAGPATALTGTSASTDGTGTLVTLDGSPDLSAVAIDGSHVIYLEDTTTGNRRFAAINATDNTAKTVTVEQAFAVGLSGKNWAIGGVRASLFSNPSALLIENNSANGDAMPGWTTEMLSGHSETTSLQIDVRRPGTASLPITIRGQAGLSDANLPKVDFDTSNALAAFRVTTQYRIFRDFQMTTSAVGGYAGDGFSELNNGDRHNVYEGLIVGDPDASHTGFNRGFDLDIQNLHGHPRVHNCVSQNNTVGFSTNSTRDFLVSNCIFRDNSSHGIELDGQRDNGSAVFLNCLVVDNGGDGINEIAMTGAVDLHRSSIQYINCTIANNTGDGIKIPTNSDRTSWEGRLIFNNIIAGNGGYGINASGTINSGDLLSDPPWIAFNIFNGNTSGAITPTAVADLSVNESTADPQFVDDANGDYTPGDNAESLACFASVRGKIGTFGNAPGAIQPTYSGGGGGSGGGSSSTQAGTQVYPFRQWVEDDFDSGSGGGGATVHPLYAN